ncbi:hypothetical protein HELRODRAFT_165443 [Helobdella robusta]|uniref:Uncharacterized protein n=1 Tax=Helobdella robusta TaxID=6412 RepID=T1EWT0_HELRO|nr:hypothetical protein HELRODRAFT_165443 [Helobdella robusta]ESN91410.1 hypothetical protein HELRODRAFT_165443 [Helobdella robusta]
MASKRRSCKNKPDVFCYICGEYTLVHNRNQNLTYEELVTTNDQDKPWAPHRTCAEGLRNWSRGLKTFLSFGIPMIWREPKNHTDELLLLHVLRPVPHGDDIPVPIPIDIAKVLPDDESSYDDVETDKDTFLLSNSDSRITGITFKGIKNIKFPKLVEPNRMLLPPLHIKLRLMKQL